MGSIIVRILVFTIFAEMKKTGILFNIFLIIGLSALAQNGYVSDNNNVGLWTDAGIWTRSQGWMQPTPGTTVGGAASYVDLYGYVSRNGDLTLGGSAAVTVYDTLWIMGNLNVSGGSSLDVQSGGILVVDGNFVGSGGTVSSNNGNIIVKGDLTISGGADINNNSAGSDGFYVYGTVSRSGGAQFNGSNNISAGNFRDESDLSTHNGSLNNFVNATLPVELVDISASFANEKVNLKWVTASELNNDKFEIYRSINGTDFEYLGEVKGNGTTSTLHEYTFVDNSPENGTIYYRIKQIDFDGSYEYSPSVSVRLELSSIILQVVPTVVKEGNIKIKACNIGQGRTPMIISNLKGNVVFDDIIDLKAGAIQHIELTGTDQLRQGIYMLTFFSGGTQYRKKVIIDR